MICKYTWGWVYNPLRPMLMTWGWGHTALGPLLMTPVPHLYPHPEGVTSARRVPSELVTRPPRWVHNLHRVNVTVNSYTYFLLTSH